MSNQPRSSGGAVRNLRAMFEQQDGSLTPPLAPAQDSSRTRQRGTANGLFRTKLRPRTDISSSRAVSAPINSILVTTPTAQYGKSSISYEKCDPQNDSPMARNPYAGLSAGPDPYTNGSSYGAPSVASSTEEYDPYGDRYGTPPISTASSSRDRRGGAGRTGGYGGFYDDSNGSAPAVQPAAQQQDRFDGYGQRSEDEPPARASPNRRPYASERNNARGYREDRSDADSDRSRGPDYRRGGERFISNGNGSSEVAVGRSRGAVRGGGDGTRQIEGQ